MRTNSHLDQDENALAEMGYETEDVEYKGLFRSIGWFFMFVTFCGVAGVAIFGALIGFNKLTNPPEQTSPFVRNVPAEPNPLLQTNETAKTDIRDLRQQENAALHGKPAWIDQSKGVIRIPVEKAIDLYARRVGAGGETTITSGAPPAGAAQTEEGSGGEKP